MLKVSVYSYSWAEAEVHFHLAEIIAKPKRNVLHCPLSTVNCLLHPNVWFTLNFMKVTCMPTLPANSCSSVILALWLKNPWYSCMKVCEQQQRPRKLLSDVPNPPFHHHDQGTSARVINSINIPACITAVLPPPPPQHCCQSGPQL